MPIMDGSVDVERKDWRRLGGNSKHVKVGGVDISYSSYHSLFCRCRADNFLHADVFDVILNTFFCNRFPDSSFHFPYSLESFFFRVAGLLV